VQSGSIEHARKVAARIRSGNVHINGAGADFTQPFGGYKQSGNARDKCFESLLEYTQMKSAWIRLST
jgi:aldehyde dehydrogenase (NAD+)